jgi:hypothetical protein
MPRYGAVKGAKRLMQLMKIAGMQMRQNMVWDSKPIDGTWRVFSAQSFLIHLGLDGDMYPISDGWVCPILSFPLGGPDTVNQQVWWSSQPAHLQAARAKKAWVQAEITLHNMQAVHQARIRNKRNRVAQHKRMVEKKQQEKNENNAALYKTKIMRLSAQSKLPMQALHVQELWRVQLIDQEALQKQALQKEALQKEALQKEARKKEERQQKEELEEQCIHVRFFETWILD